MTENNLELNVSLERWNEWSELRMETSRPMMINIEGEEQVKHIVPTMTIAEEWNSRYPDESWIHFTRPSIGDNGAIRHGFLPAFAFVMDPHPNRYANDSLRSVTLCRFDEALKLSKEIKEKNISR